MNRLLETPDGRLAPALFLDFDGTLAPIARRPEEVRPDPRLPATLARLQGALGGALAVVSGRPLAEVDAFLAPLCLPGAGAHGVERRDGDGKVSVRAGVPPAAAVTALSELAGSHAGLRLEVKPSSLALHYREAPAFEERCIAAARSALARQPGWALQRGKCVVELRPADVTKGRTIEWFMRRAPFAGRMPVFVGDDDADEDGFAVVQAVGGWGVKVGPGATCARLRLDTPDEVLHWLERLTGQLEVDALEPQGAARVAG